MVNPSLGSWWLGGLYYVQHLALAASRPELGNQARFLEVCWGDSAEPGFGELGDVVASPLRLGMPKSLRARAHRRLRGFLHGRRPGRTVADIFLGGGVDVLFPVAPCERAGIPEVFLLTDFQYRRRPDFYSHESWQRFETYNRTQATKATLVSVCSESVARDGEEFLPEFKDKFRVVFARSVPTPIWWAGEPREVVARYGLPARFFLISNQICRHKNHLTVLRALRVLRSRGHCPFVVCTGRLDDYRDPHFADELQRAVVELGLTDAVRFLGAIPRSDQIALLRECVASLQPSEFEGWGAAVADARAVGKRVFASDLPAHREHGLGEGDYLPPLDVEAWADVMSQSWGDEAGGIDESSERAAAARAQGEIVKAGRDFLSVLVEAVRLGVPEGEL